MSGQPSSRRRIHVNIGPVCNNNCLFCMEQDRRRRQRVNGALTPQRVHAILEQNRGCGEVCFTSGEPTLVPELPDYLSWARRLGYGRISLMTNGRRLAYADYCERLVDAGLGYFYVSIHAAEARTHDGLVRVSGAFAQTVAGLKHAARLAPRVGLHSSTVVTRRNLDSLAAIYAFLRGLGVQQVVFNVMQATGRAQTHFGRLFPPYAEISAAFGVFLEGLDERDPPVFLVDIPLCVTEQLPRRQRGKLEPYVHFEVGAGETVEIAREEHDSWQRSKQAACTDCVHDTVCPGVWNNYLARYGWSELRPVIGGSKGSKGSKGSPGV